CFPDPGCAASGLRRHHGPDIGGWRPACHCPRTGPSPGVPDLAFNRRAVRRRPFRRRLGAVAASPRDADHLVTERILPTERQTSATWRMETRLKFYEWQKAVAPSDG